MFMYNVQYRAGSNSPDNAIKRTFGVQPGMIGVETSGSFADDHGDSLTKSAWRMKGRHGNSLNW